MYRSQGDDFLIIVASTVGHGVMGSLRSKQVLSSYTATPGLANVQGLAACVSWGGILLMEETLQIYPHFIIPWFDQFGDSSWWMKVDSPKLRFCIRGIQFGVHLEFDFGMYRIRVATVDVVVDVPCHSGHYPCLHGACCLFSFLLLSLSLSWFRGSLLSVLKILRTPS